MVEVPDSPQPLQRGDVRALVAALVLCACLLSAALIDGGLIAHPMTGLLLLVVSGAAWLFGSRAKVQRAALVLAALLSLRLVALLVGPSLSDDIHRYVHEGRASRLGLAVPFETPPSRITPPPDDGTTARVNHPEVPAAYPPTSQLFLLLTVFVGDALGAPTAALRLALALCDVVVVLLLFRRRRSRPDAFLLYGLHPLPLLEACVGSHLDALGAGLIVVAILYARAPWLRGVLVGLSMGIKPTALLALLAGPLRRRALILMGAGIALGVLVPTLPYLVAGAPLGRGIVEYTTRWEAQPTFFSAAHAVFAPTFERRARDDVWAHAHLSGGGLLVEEAGVERLDVGAGRTVRRPLLLDDKLFARGLVFAALLACLGAAARLRDENARVAWAFTALWLLAPTMHPWYLLWALPFAALARTRGILWWGAVAPLSYEAAMRAAQTGEWSESSWPRAIGLLVLTLGTLLDVAAQRRAAAASSSSRATED